MLGTPSAELAEKIEKEEKERVKKQRETLGEEGLKEKKEVLEASIKQNEVREGERVREGEIEREREGGKEGREGGGERGIADVHVYSVGIHVIHVYSYSVKSKFSAGLEFLNFVIKNIIHKKITSYF